MIFELREEFVQSTENTQHVPASLKLRLGTWVKGDEEAMMATEGVTPFPAPKGRKHVDPCTVFVGVLTQWTRISVDD